MTKKKSVRGQQVWRSESMQILDLSHPLQRFVLIKEFRKCQNGMTLKYYLLSDDEDDGHIRSSFIGISYSECLYGNALFLLKD